MNRAISLAIPALAALMIIATCASERAISGGPEDKTPPEVIFSTPVTGSTGVEAGTEVRIRFSEQMQKSTVRTALQIWPRPPGGFEVTTGWTWVKVSFNDLLASGETYLVTIDKTAKDLRGNPLAATYTLAFSTGDSLNAGKIRGSITGNSEVRKSGNILLFRELRKSLDQLSSAEADYIFQPDDGGAFELNYLSNQQYLLYYHWDRNKNKVIDENDYFGRPEQYTVFARTDSLVALQSIWPQVVPPGQVKLLEVSRLNDRMYQLRTNLQYQDSTFDSLALFAQDSQVHIQGASRVQGDEVAMHLLLSDTLSDAANVWITGFIDTSGFSLHSDTLQVNNAVAEDSLTFLPIRVTWQNGLQKKYAGEAPLIRLRGNLPFEGDLDSAFQIYQAPNDSIPISGTFGQSSAMEWNYTVNDTILDGASFNWRLHTEYLDVPLKGNELDSLWQGKLTTVNRDSLGSIRIKYMGVNNLSCRLMSIGVEKEFELKQGAGVLIEDLPATSYTLVGYLDQNGDGRYNSGGMAPYSGAEPFWIYEEPITVRARWETDIGTWILK